MFNFGDGNGPVPAHRHQNPDGSEGGWIAETANVADTATVGKDAKGSGNACVSDHAQITGSAQVYGKAQVFDEALVYNDAVIHALKSTKKGSAVQLFTDSMEVVSGYRKQHSENFLWKTFNQLYRERFVTMKWVKGHNGNLYNEMADSLARKACTTLRKKI